MKDFGESLESQVQRLGAGLSKTFPPLLRAGHEKEQEGSEAGRAAWSNVQLWIVMTRGLVYLGLYTKCIVWTPRFHTERGSS